MFKSQAESIREWLKAYRMNEKMIDERLDKIRTLRARIMGVGTKPLSDMPKPPSGCGNPLEEYIIQLESLESELRKEIEVHNSSRKAIEDVIDGLSKKDEQMVLRYRYLYGYEWSDVLYVLYKDDSKFPANRDTYKRKMYRIHEEALKNMAKNWSKKNTPH